jgi:Mn-containing catalase
MRIRQCSKSLAEEENADQFPNQVAPTLMSVARMPAAIEQRWTKNFAGAY